MEMAIPVYGNGDMRFTECYRHYYFPKLTLKRHIDNKNAKANENVNVLHRTTTLLPDLVS